MIIGEVNSDKLAVVPASVKGAGLQAGIEITIAFMLDTGFDGFISLPPEMVGNLELPFVQERLFYLADDSATRFAAHAAIIVWNGEERGVLALASDGPPTIGTGLLHGFHLFADWVDGGVVRIEARDKGI